MNITNLTLPFPMQRHWDPSPVDHWQAGQARWCMDDKAFVVQVQFEAVNPSNPVRADNEDAWEKGDLMEIFLQDPSASFYSEWHLTPEGHVWRRRFELEDPDAPTFGDSSFIEDPAAPARDFLLDGTYWQARLSIPWVHVTESGERPQRLRWAVCRYDYEAGGNPILSSTAFFTKPSYHRRMEWHLSEG